MAHAHVVNTGADGTLSGMTANEVRALVEEAVQSPRIVLHFHGGLVDEAAGLATAARLTSVYQDAGAYPVFFVWQSGAIETIKHNLLEIAREELFERLLRQVLSFAAGKVRDRAGERRGLSTAQPSERELSDQLAARRCDTEPEAGTEPFAAEPVVAAGELTPAEERQFLREVENDAELRRLLAGAMASRQLEMADAEGRRVVPDVPPVPTRMDADVLQEIAEAPDAGARGVVSWFTVARKALEVLRAVLKRYDLGTESGLYPTVVEELLRAFYLGDLGAAEWQAMKKETADTFEAGERGGRLVLDVLAELLPQHEEVQITLVGHSTGAVFIDHLLSEVVRRREEDDKPLPDSVRFQIAFLAPAATTQHFATTLEKAEPLVHRLRMFTMDDATEQADRLVGAVYPRSLLYLVSGLLERNADKSSLMPLVGLARYLDGDVAELLKDELGPASRLEASRTFFEVTDRVVRSPSDGQAAVGFRASAKKHGDFDNNDLVLESVAHMISSW